MICKNHPRYRGLRRTARHCFKCKIIRALYCVKEFLQPDMNRVLKRLNKQRAKKEQAPEYRKFLFCGGPANGITRELPTDAACWFVGSVKYVRRNDIDKGGTGAYFAPELMHPRESDAIYEYFTTPPVVRHGLEVAPEKFDMKVSCHTHGADYHISMGEKAYPRTRNLLFVGGVANGLTLEVPIGTPQYNYTAGDGCMHGYYLQRDAITDTYFFAHCDLGNEEAVAAYGALKLSQEPA